MSLLAIRRDHHLYVFTIGRGHKRPVNPTSSVANTDLPPVAKTRTSAGDFVPCSGRGCSYNGVIGTWAFPHVYWSVYRHPRRHSSQFSCKGGLAHRDNVPGRRVRPWVYVCYVHEVLPSIGRFEDNSCVTPEQASTTVLISNPNL